MYFEAYKKANLANENPAQTEYRIFAEITRELETANSNAGTTNDRINAVFRNSRLWLTLKADLVSSENHLNKETKAGLISLAIWVEKFTGDPHMDLKSMVFLCENYIFCKNDMIFM